MRFFIAMLIGKMIYAVGSRIGRATNLPGEIALKICPDLLGRFKVKGKILAVTGTNGKTTTANLIAHIIKDNGCTIAHNAKGSNLTGGIATTMLTSSNFKGYIDRDYVVLEVDERYSRLIFKLFSPDYLLITNLFRDQLTRNGNVDVIISILGEAIKKNVKLILNGCDPISGDILPENERVYYGMERTSASTDESISITHDAKVCPRCFGKMEYEYFHYNHIGKYHCTKCGFTNPEYSYKADNVDLTTGDFTVNGTAVHTDYKAPFHFLNITGAIALCTEAGLPFESVAKSASTFKMLAERYDEFTVGDRKAYLILSKNQNPVSFDQSISYVLSTEGKKTAVIYVNNINHTNHRDTTWLYDIGFERFVDKLDYCICTGPRAYDLAVRMKLAGYPEEKTIIEPDREGMKAAVAKTEGNIYVLTELYDAEGIISAIR